MEATKRRQSFAETRLDIFLKGEYTGILTGIKKQLRDSDSVIQKGNMISLYLDAPNEAVDNFVAPRLKKFTTGLNCKYMNEENDLYERQVFLDDLAISGKGYDPWKHGKLMLTRNSIEGDECEFISSVVNITYSINPTLLKKINYLEIKGNSCKDKIKLVRLKFENNFWEAKPFEISFGMDVGAFIDDKSILVKVI